MLLTLSLKVKVTEVAGVMITSAGGRITRATLMMVCDTPVDKSLDSLDDKSEFAAMNELLQMKLNSNHQRNRWSLDKVSCIELPRF